MGDFGKALEDIFWEPLKNTIPMVGGVLGVGDQFAPQASAQPEAYGPPPATSFAPYPVTDPFAAAQQAPSVIPPANVSPLLQNVFSDVQESPATGLSLEDEMKKRSTSQTGGMGV